MSSGRTRSSITGTLQYPEHLFSPEDFVEFVQASRFSSRWDKLGLKDIDLGALEVMIMADPKGNPVIRGTGGLRKMRFGRADKGSRGAYRICYVYFEEVQIVHLLVVYAKNEKDDLSDAERAACKLLIEEISKTLGQ